MTDVKDLIKRNRFLYKIAWRLRNCQNSRSYNRGKKNSVDCNGIKLGTKIQIKGDRNIITIEKGAVLNNCRIFIHGNDNRIIVGKDSQLDSVELWIEDNGNEIRIGYYTFIGHDSHFACTENGCKIIIGDNCLFSSFIQIRTGDSHSILDAEGVRINKAKDVIIGNHCWIGQDVKILKGSQLGANSVVATGSIVTGEFSNNMLIGGNPARLIRENINWNSTRL